MFKPNEIERFSMALDPQMKKLEERIMEDIVRRIKINGEITRAADWQINRLQQLGVSMKTVENEIQRALDLDDADMEKLYSDITERGYARDNKLYEATGKQQIPFEDNAELQQLISSVAGQTNETLKNITQSLGFAVRQPDGKLGWSPLAQYYQQTLDGVMLDIASGAFDYNTVLKRVVNEMTNSGLRTIDYATGHKNRVDVAARRALMTGMSQITAKVNADNMEALDTEYVEVTWHGGARPSHQVWQGKIYHWRRGGNTGTAVPVANQPQKAQKVQYPAGKALTSGEKSGIIKENFKMAADSEFSLEDKTFTVKEDPEGVQKAYDFARNELGAGNVNFSAVKNAEVLQPLLDQLKVLKDKHEQHFFQIFVQAMDDHVFAEVAPDLSLHLNSTYINSKEALDDLLARLKKKKLVPTGHDNLEYLITHEYMHFISRSDVDNPRSKLQKFIPKDKKTRDKHLPSYNSVLRKAEYVADAMAMIELGESDNVWQKIYDYYFLKNRS